VKELPKTPSKERTPGSTGNSSQWRQNCARVATQLGSACRRSKIQQLRDSIIREQGFVQTAESASALNVARVIVDFMEDLPELQRRNPDAAVSVKSLYSEPSIANDPA
jgi:hypothetical protein